MTRYLGRQLHDPLHNVSGTVIREWTTGYRDWWVLLQVNENTLFSTLASRCGPVPGTMRIRLVCRDGERVG
jgi:hypothetical protein